MGSVKPYLAIVISHRAASCLPRRERYTNPVDKKPNIPPIGTTLEVIGPALDGCPCCVSIEWPEFGYTASGNGYMCPRRNLMRIDDEADAMTTDEPVEAEA